MERRRGKGRLPRRPTRQLVRVGSAAVAAVLAALAAGLVIAAVAFGMGIAPVLSGSMRPTFGPGSAVVTRTIPTRDVRVGDVVVFTPPGWQATLAHRVVSVSGPPGDRVITTKGDANRVPDPWRAHLVGTNVPVVVFSVPWVGNVFEHVRGLAVRVLLVVLAGLAVCAAGTRAILGPRPGTADPGAEEMAGGMA